MSSTLISTPKARNPGQGPLALFAPVPKGIEELLAQEVRDLGGQGVRVARAGVSFRGTLETAMRVVYWSRTASRLILPLVQGAAATPEEIYALALALPWEEHISADGTLAVDFTGTSPAIRHTRFGAQTVKDAIVDRLRERSGGRRPSVQFDNPDVRINAILEGERLRLGIDLAGGSLHRRGYRQEESAAPLKENLAAALLLLAGWPHLAAQGAPLVDPLCGSGTLVIEAGLMAGDVAPGLLRAHTGFTGWLGHDPALWRRIQDEAQERRRDGEARIPALYGLDADHLAVRAAELNALAAGLAGHASFVAMPVERLILPVGVEKPGLLAANPPYGQRMGEVERLIPLYRTLGNHLRQHFAGWRAAIFTAEPDLAAAVGLPVVQKFDLFNGAIPCQLTLHELAGATPAPVMDQGAMVATPDGALGGGMVDDVGAVAHDAGVVAKEVGATLSPVQSLVAGGSGEAFANRLRKNLKQLRGWAKREGISCYRVYDADIPEFALAVDLFEEWAHVQEYAPPATIDPQVAEQRRQLALALLPELLGIPPSHLFYKERTRGRGGERYGKLAEQGHYHVVHEGGYRFQVNFTDHLDVGLFLDHRMIRHLVGTLAQGKRFLNLFGYTGTATVHAAGGGAISTTTVDLSTTYLEWAARNFALNGMDGRFNRLVQGDCLAWLEQAPDEAPYDLIFLDPPTFSNSKRMDKTFDLQRHYGDLLHGAVERLTPDGVLIFSCNARRFRFDSQQLPMGMVAQELTRATMPPDFKRNPRIHGCWKITAG